MKYKAFLFDCDGTIIDTNKLIFNGWSAAVHSFAPDADFRFDDISKLFGMTLEDTVVILAKKYGVDNYDMKAIHDCYWNYHSSHYDEITGVYPGIEEALKVMKEKGAKIGVVTSGKYETCHAELAKFGINKYVDAIIGDEIDIPKPDARPALVCCEKLGVKPQETMLIGDSKHDIACGNRAGCTTAMVSWSLCSNEGLKDFERPDIIINNASELIEYI